MVGGQLSFYCFLYNLQGMVMPGKGNQHRHQHQHLNDDCRYYNRSILDAVLLCWFNEQWLHHRRRHRRHHHIPSPIHLNR